MKKYFVTLCLGLGCLCANSQVLPQKMSLNTANSLTNELFSENEHIRDLPLTDTTYIFAIKVSVHRAGNRDSIIIDSVTCSDSVAHVILPDMDFLHRIPYAAFMPNIDSVDFIFSAYICKGYGTKPPTSAHWFDDFTSKYWYSPSESSRWGRIYIPTLTAYSSNTVEDY